MVSYANMSDKEIQEYREKSKKEFEEKYKGRIDPKTGRWLSGKDAMNAIFDDSVAVGSCNITVGRSPAD